MNDDRLIALVDELRNHTAEEPWFEFKRSNSDPVMIGVRISALANASRVIEKHYGYLVWGIDDETHAVVGTNFNPSQKHKGEPMQMWLAKTLNPSPQFRFLPVNHPGGRVIVLQIPAATHTPVKFDRVAYIRVGSATPRLDGQPELERALWAKLQTFAWEKGVALQHLTTGEALEALNYASYFELLGEPVPATSVTVLERLLADKLLTRDVGDRWNILNLGAILFANRLDAFDDLKRKAVRVVEYAGKDQSRIRRRRDQADGYGSGFANLIDFINEVAQGDE